MGQVNSIREGIFINDPCPNYLASEANSLLPANIATFSSSSWSSSTENHNKSDLGLVLKEYEGKTCKYFKQESKEYFKFRNGLNFR